MIILLTLKEAVVCQLLDLSVLDNFCPVLNLPFLGRFAEKVGNKLRVPWRNWIIWTCFSHVSDWDRDGL